MKFNRKFWFELMLIASFVALTSSLSAQVEKPAPAAPATPRDADTVIIEQRTRDLATRLTLTDEQRGKVKALYKDEVRQMALVREDQSLSIPDRSAKFRSIREMTNGKIKELLTPEQAEKWEKMRTRRPRQPAAATPPAPNSPAPPTAPK